MQDIVCPICNADLPLTGEEDQGSTIYCPYCSSPIRIVSISDTGDVVLREDF